VVGDLRRLVEDNPYRERHVAQLMVALYRTGRQAEALDAYESARRRLAELGIRPGPDLQRLSGQIVRHEAKLSTPSGQDRRIRVVQARWLVVAIGLVVALASVLAIERTGGRGGGAAGNTAASRPRVALVLPRSPRAGREDAVVTQLVDGLRRAAHEYDLDTRTLVLGDGDDGIVRRIRAGEFDLVISAGLASTIVPLVSRAPDTRFVYLDASVRGTPLERSLNATGVPFADAESGYLAGFLSGQMSAREGRSRIVSVVAGHRSPGVTRFVRSFVRGARTARARIAVKVDYASSSQDQPVCERIANRQIDQGSTVVFAAAGPCGLGALAAARIRGVWGVGHDIGGWGLGSHLLATTVKRYDRAVVLAVRWFLHRTLPRGDVVLGLDDEAVGIADISPEVPGAVRKQLAQVEATLRAAEAAPRS
jgi:basic membrane protein A and related proteins